MKKTLQSLFLCLLGLSFCSVLAAQEPSLVTSEATDDASTPRWQNFHVVPEISLTGLYDSNLFADHDQEASDRVLIVAPMLTISSQWPQHKLSFGLGGRFGRYDRFSSEDYDDFDLGLSGRYDLTEDSNLFGGIAYREGHEERGLTVEEPTDFVQQEAHLGTSYSPGKLRLRFGGTYEQLDFDDSTLPGGLEFNNDDRDRSLYGLGLRLGYAYQPSLQPFVQMIYDRRRYDERLDDQGFARDSDGYRAAAGIKSEPWPGFESEVYLGYLWQDYDDRRFGTVHKPTFSGSVSWLVRPSTILSAQIDRSLNETTLPESSGYLRTEYNLNLRERILSDMEFHAYLGLAQDDYNKLDREDDYYSAGFGLRYDLNETLYLAADYSYIERNSTENSEEYDRHQLMVSLGASLGAKQEEPLAGFTPLLETAGHTGPDLVAPSGFYLGVQVGHGGLTTETNEIRHSGDSSSKFGRVDFSGGMFAGYGHAFGRWLTALELGVEESSLDWKHGKDKPNSRTMEISRDESVSGSLRLGYLLENGSLLFGRAGVVSTRFHDYYTINDLPQNALSEDETLLGLRLGLGLDVPVTERLFLRMESTYTDYESDDLVTVDFDETFDNTETTFNVGLGWRLDPQPLPQKTVAPDSLGGFYGGARLGYGTNNSDVEALHQDGGSNPGIYNYQADFGNDDFTAGLFAGYGVIYQKLYLGAEIDIEVSPAEWARERSEGSGRTFSVDKQIGYGVSARIGYILSGGNLVYARVGVVETKFNTRYVKGNNPDNYIDRDDSQSGIRIGCGLEVPITEKAFFRLEYSQTDYDNYHVTTAHSLSDQLDIDHVETLASIAIGIRF